jgi:hypothetical protein
MGRAGLGQMLASWFGRNRASGGDRPEQGRGLGKRELIGGSQSSATKACVVTGWLHTWEWAAVGAELGWLRIKWPTIIFSILISFSN